MQDKSNEQKSLQLNIDWFQKSGVLDPSDGSWGVAERIVLSQKNDALKKTLQTFPTYVNFASHVLLEHRRPDCNFEAALLFFLASEALDNEDYYKVADNLLKYLFYRSGSRNCRVEYPAGVWRWSHDQWRPAVWFDDNAWVIALSITIGNMDSCLKEKYNLIETALETASSMLKGFEIQFDAQGEPDETWRWTGDLRSPHWGSLVCMAFAYSYKHTGLEKYREAAQKYHEYLDKSIDTFTTSEYAYILIGASACSKYMESQLFREIALYAADQLLSKIDKETGNIPAEWGKEAPVGKHLVDLIYTQNWVVLGFHMLASISDDEKYRNGLEKVLSLLAGIQDMSSEAWLHGCWRGMYDLNTDTWNGGDRFEGGASSIYTGWTNAPISIVQALRITGKSLLV